MDPKNARVHKWPFLNRTWPGFCMVGVDFGSMLHIMQHIARGIEESREVPGWFLIVKSLKLSAVCNNYVLVLDLRNMNTHSSSLA
jgi:hypothetical protein